jgi:hypothetical protein
MHVLDLSESIRKRVLHADLPRDLRTPVITGPADGRSVCDCCSRPIAPSEAQHEVGRRAANGGPGAVSMHSDCFRLWRNVVETLYLLDGAAGVRCAPAGTTRGHIESSCL